MRFVAIAAGILAVLCVSPPEAKAEAPRLLTLATWNLEHLAEKDGMGCRPRTAQDYALLKAYAEQLNAVIVAVQEVDRGDRRIFGAQLFCGSFSTFTTSGIDSRKKIQRYDASRIQIALLLSQSCSAPVGAHSGGRRSPSRDHDAALSHNASDIYYQPGIDRKRHLARLEAGLSLPTDPVPT
jgi:hypothetical protein